MCKDCQRIMTWAEKKVQFKRLKKLALSNENIKLALPSCQKCLTTYLENKF